MPPRLDPRLAQRLDAKKALLDARRPLPPATLRRLYDDLKILLTYHSNAIEGNTLSLRETQLVIEHGLTVGGHPLRDYLATTNHAAAFALLSTLADQDTPLSTAEILDLHRLVMAGILEDAGQWRTIPVTIRGAQLTPPPPPRVPALMAEWVAWVAPDGPGQQYVPIIRAAIAHHGFEAVHPFVDGNGRVGRLLLNLLLMRAGYPPALLLRDWRGSYVQALANADRGNYNPLANLIGRAVEAGLDRYLDVSTAGRAEAELPLAELARQTEYSAAHLGWLVRQGRLEAVKRGGRWYSTRAALEQYRREVEEGTIPKGRPRLDS